MASPAAVAGTGSVYFAGNGGAGGVVPVVSQPAMYPQQVASTTQVILTDQNGMQHVQQVSWGQGTVKMLTSF